MKISNFTLLLPIVALLMGCNSKNNSIEVLHQNAQSYNQLENSSVYHSKSAIVSLEMAENQIKIDLITKDRNNDLSIVECKDKKSIYPLTQTASDQFGDHYILDIPNNKKSIKLTCKLSNNESFTKTLTKYN